MCMCMSGAHSVCACACPITHGPLKPYLLMIAFAKPISYLPAMCPTLYAIVLSGSVYMSSKLSSAKKM